MLDKRQMEAVTHFGSPCLIIASPGSGKTTVIIERIRFLINKKNVDPSKILVITFTNASVNEMRDRFLKLERKNQSVIFSTFHSIFFHILKKELKFQTSDIIDEKTKREFLRYSLKQNNINIDFTEELYKELLKEFFIIRQNENHGNHDIKNDKNKSCYVNIFNTYEKIKYKYKKIDFLDMIFLTLKLFKEKKEILIKWKNEFSHILVDEAQDMNDMQYELLKMLSNENVFVVGDDDQSIYGFRGANPKIMLSFKNDFKNAKLYYLEKNYRSAKNIVYLSKKVIENNKCRYNKNILAANERIASIYYMEFNNLKEEAKYVANRIYNLIKFDKYKKDKTAILVRNRMIASSVLEELKNKKIKVKGKIKCNYNNKYILTFKAILHLALKNNEQLYERKYIFLILPIFEIKINRMYFDDEIIDINKIIENDFLDEQSKIFLRKLKADINMISKMNPFALITFIKKIWKFDSFLNREKAENEAEVNEALNFFKYCSKKAGDFDTVYEFLEYIKIYENTFYNILQNNEGEGMVYINTFHSVKGLEYDNVFIIGSSDGITPSYKARKLEELEEERRMFYVAITRAKKMLFISGIKRIGNKTYTLSRFLYEMMN